MKKSFLLLVGIVLLTLNLKAQHSVARKWNDVLLEGIRNDFARPTVHARNLFHVSAAMYDAWAIFDYQAEPYLLGQEVHGFTSTFNGFTPVVGTDEENIEKALSYAAYRIIEHRFANSPDVDETMILANSLFADLGYDFSNTLTNYSNGSSAALGNYIAEQYIQYGLQDGANEDNDYSNEFYLPSNNYLFAEDPGNPNLTDPNKWQPLAFEDFVDQSGNPTDQPDFLSPEWGSVAPFSLSSSDLTVHTRNSNNYLVYHDPGPPPMLGEDSLYQWNFAMVAVWSGHLDANLDAEIDISPGNLGNFNFANFPSEFDEYNNFYDFRNGGDASSGRTMNPSTGLSYEPSVVKLGDYGRILAEFWADGPDSETPPGHWFTLLNGVSDDIAEKKLNGQGSVVSDLEWDIKSYFMLGGAMHDVAISAWGIKGWYDYIRPISAIRYMVDKGQSSDDQLSSYHKDGIPLVDDYIELVEQGDPLAGDQNEHVGKIKLKAWKGPDYISDPDTDVAGVDWILGENWWPYQRPTFITPPFAGYVSGHSTYSRAAAELLTLLTGDSYFPNGLGEFIAPMNDFLVFEEGPSETITLQWATYQDASDQCSLSRIWGGIHPPADDIPGRIIGEAIGKEAYTFAQNYFLANPLGANPSQTIGLLYPNPTNDFLKIKLPDSQEISTATLFNLNGQVIRTERFKDTMEMDISALTPGRYLVKINNNKWSSSHFVIKN